MGPAPLDIPGGIPGRCAARRRDEPVDRRATQVAGELRPYKIEQRLAIPRDKRVDVHDPGDPFRNTVRIPSHDHASITLPYENDVTEAVELEVLDHILDMRVEIDGHRSEMA